jgi:hypothetical protein
LVVATAMVGGRTARAATPAQVEQAIDRGRDFLFKAQQNGNWEAVQARVPAAGEPGSIVNGQWGGMTAIATLALLASGVDANDPHVQQAVAFLRKAEVIGNYALGLRAQVWGLLPVEPWVRKAELADRDLLERGLRTGRGEAEGMYGYFIPGTQYDHSVSQFDVLGMWSLVQAGVEVPTGYWNLVDEYRAAADSELSKLFPDAHGPLPVLPPDAPVYAAAGPAMSAKAVAYRQYQRPGQSLHDPQLRGLTVGNRVAVFYSPLDVSVGLVGQPVDGVAGYVPADATRVVSDVIAYAAHPR